MGKAFQSDGETHVPRACAKDRQKPKTDKRVSPQKRKPKKWNGMSGQARNPRIANVSKERSNPKWLTSHVHREPQVGKTRVSNKQKPMKLEREPCGRRKPPQFSGSENYQN